METDNGTKDDEAGENRKHTSSDGDEHSLRLKNEQKQGGKNWRMEEEKKKEACIKKEEG